MLYVDTCALCLNTSELQRSHILPKYAYRRARSEETNNPNPVMFRRGGVAHQTSEQIRMRLLCTECEQRFAVFERYAALVYNTVHERVLPASEPLENGWRELTPVPGKLDLARLRYFGVSVIWRAHHYYRSEDPQDLKSVNLGKYESQVREFLLGGADLPGAFSMAMYEDRPGVGSIAGRLASFPVGGRCRDGVWRHSFLLGGLDFCLMPGKSHFPVLELVAGPTTSLRHSYGFIGSLRRAPDLDKGLQLKKASIGRAPSQ